MAHVCLYINDDPNYTYNSHGCHFPLTVFLSTVCNVTKHSLALVALWHASRHCSLGVMSQWADEELSWSSLWEAASWTVSGRHIGSLLGTQTCISLKILIIQVRGRV